MGAQPDLRADRRWIVCQLGAREHYAVARSLAGAEALAALATDAWAPPGSVRARLHRRLRERFHPDLAATPVRHWSESLLAFELLARARGQAGWDLILARNAWFGGRLADWLRALPVQNAGPVPVVFSYSYAALEGFRVARQRRWRTVLGQIDPGPVEAELVAAEQAAFGEGRTRWAAPPARYWDAWRAECELADAIVVNSEWSREALLRVGMPEQKVSVIPLAYEVAAAPTAPKEYPAKFDSARPLRVLFLGQVNLRKGVARVIEAARLLAEMPIEFWMVGPLELAAPPPAASTPGMQWLGPVPRGEVARYYREADVFLFPTLSDGFGLTQLEAQSHRLPVIASRCCGEVVRDGVNGLVLPEPTASAIAGALRKCLAEPARLAAWSAGSGVESRFRPHSIARQFQALAV